jgi:hypothetical protein
MHKIVLIYNNIIKATNPYIFQALIAHHKEYNNCIKQLPDIQAGLVLRNFTLITQKFTPLFIFTQ